jgi:hypothetical protein
VQGVPGNRHSYCDSISALGGFEAWNTCVRQALIWAGEADPLAGQDTLALDNDTGTDALRDLLEAWSACYGTSANALKSAKQDIEMNAAKQGQPNKWNRLRDALCEFDARAQEGLFNVRAVGNRLRALRGCVLNGQRWEQVEKHTKHGATWCVRRLAASSASQAGAGRAEPTADTMGDSGDSGDSASPARAESGSQCKTQVNGKKHNLTLSPTAGDTASSESSESSAAATPCAHCGGVDQWDDDGIWRCVSCLRPANMAPKQKEER